MPVADSNGTAMMAKIVPIRPSYSAWNDLSTIPLACHAIPTAPVKNAQVLSNSSARRPRRVGMGRRVCDAGPSAEPSTTVRNWLGEYAPLAADQTPHQSRGRADEAPAAESTAGASTEEIRMAYHWLTPPSRAVFFLSVLLAVLPSVRYAHVAIPVVSNYTFETLLVGFLLLLAGTCSRGSSRRLRRPRLCQGSLCRRGNSGRKRSQVSRDRGTLQTVPH